MAAELSRTLKGGHDAIFEYSCEPCIKQNLGVGASFYCTDCGKLFCDECAETHDTLQTDHELITTDEYARSTKHFSHSTCSEHSPKELEKYCLRHKCLCCSLCETTIHG